MLTMNESQYLSKVKLLAEPCEILESGKSATLRNLAFMAAESARVLMSSARLSTEALIDVGKRETANEE